MIANTQENSPDGAARPNGAVLPVLAPPSPADLESVCRSVAELARSAPRPPSRIKLRHGSTTVEMEWPVGPVTDRPALAPAGAGPEQPPAAADDGLGYLCAPMVGTFYHSREPGTPPLVAVGDLVRPGQAVGILEVMKMMSTIEADRGGRVVEILVPDAQSVEYQQRLIALEPLAPAEDA